MPQKQERLTERLTADKTTLCAGTSVPSRRTINTSQRKLSRWYLYSVLDISRTCSAEWSIISYINLDICTIGLHFTSSATLVLGIFNQCTLFTYVSARANQQERSCDCSQLATQSRICHHSTEILIIFYFIGNFILDKIQTLRNCKTK